MEIVPKVAQNYYINRWIFYQMDFPFLKSIIIEMQFFLNIILREKKK